MRVFSFKYNLLSGEVTAFIGTMLLYVLSGERLQFVVAVGVFLVYWFIFVVVQEVLDRTIFGTARKLGW